MSKHLIRGRGLTADRETRVQHQFNDNAIRYSHNLGQSTGMQRIGVHQVRIEPGRDSTTHHYHDADEEFIYILSGKGQARIGDEVFAVEAGDFMGFPAPSPGHSMTNTGAEDLVYLMGGERWATDLVHYPDLNRTLLKSHGRRTWIKDDAETELPPR
ncbi:MAG: cupin domain-containing protein [Pseudomonadota bacterium]